MKTTRIATANVKPGDVFFTEADGIFTAHRLTALWIEGPWIRAQRPNGTYEDISRVAPDYYL